MVQLELKPQLQGKEVRMIEEEFSTKLDCRDRTISNLESTCEKRAEMSQKMIHDMKTCSSLQSDQIETLRSEIMKLKVRSGLQEEEKRHEMEEMKKRLELSQLEIELSQLESSFDDII